MISIIKRMRRRAKGFTLIELIVVMAIIAILAMIAVPRLAQFRELAEQRKNEANERILTGAAAMAVAEFGAPGEWDGLTVPVVWPGSMKDGVSLTDTSGKVYENAYAWGPYFDEWPAPSMEVSIDAEGNVAVNDSGSSGGVTESDPITVSRTRVVEDNISANGGTVSWGTAPTEGNLLVAIAAHRVAESASVTPSMSSSGWTLQHVEQNAPWSTSNRRLIAVWTKVAGASESTSVTFGDLNGSGGTGEANVLLTEYHAENATGFTVLGASGNHNDSEGTSLSLSGNAGENVIAVGGICFRNAPSSVNFVALNGETVSQDTTDIPTYSAWVFTDEGGSISGTNVTWSTNRYAAGLLLLVRCDQ